jgi:hypothetical protein
MIPAMRDGVLAGIVLVFAVSARLAVVAQLGLIGRAARLPPFPDR